jgi:hypothetical protein
VVVEQFRQSEIQPLVDLIGSAMLISPHRARTQLRRFAPQNAAGQATSDGIREIIVGTAAGTPKASAQS